MSPGSSMDVDPEREVKRIHLLLEDWYCGIRDEITAIEDALAPNVSFIDANGTLHAGNDVIEALNTRHAEARSVGKPVSLTIDDITVQRELYGIHQVTYTKERVQGETASKTTCSLWFRETNRVTSGLQWLHLQETPLIEEATDDQID